MKRKSKNDITALAIKAVTIGVGVIAGRYVNALSFIGGNPMIAGGVKIGAGALINVFDVGGDVGANVGLGLAGAGIIDVVDSQLSLPPAANTIKGIPDFSKIHRVAAPAGSGVIG